MAKLNQTLTIEVADESAAGGDDKLRILSFKNTLDRDRVSQK